MTREEQEEQDRRDRAARDENPYTPEEIAEAQRINDLAWGGIGILPVGETTVVSLEELAKKREAEKENPQPHGDAEMRATTFIIDGMPMTFDEMAEYRTKQKAEAQAAVEDDDDEDDGEFTSTDPEIQATADVGKGKITYEEYIAILEGLKNKNDAV